MAVECISGEAEMTAACDVWSWGVTIWEVSTQGFGSGIFPNPDPWVCTSNGEIFSNVYEMNILDNIKRHLFCLYTFVVRRPLKALEPRIRSEFSPNLKH